VHGLAILHAVEVQRRVVLQHASLVDQALVLRRHARHGGQRLLELRDRGGGGHAHLVLVRVRALDVHRDRHSLLQERRGEERREEGKSKK
jgi:hypothetical protein